MGKPFVNSRKCDGCGDHYFRRNQIECWTNRAPGARKGWFKEVARICNKCMSIKQARVVFGMFGIELSRPAREKVLSVK